MPRLIPHRRIQFVRESLVSQDSWDGSCFTSHSPFLDCLVENPQISSDLNPIPIHCLVENPQRSSDLNPRTPHPITYQLSAAYIPPDTYCTVNYSDQGHDAGNNDDHNKVLDLFPKAGAKCSHTLKASDKTRKYSTSNVFVKRPKNFRHPISIVELSKVHMETLKTLHYIFVSKQGEIKEGKRKRTVEHLCNWFKSSLKRHKVRLLSCSQTKRVPAENDLFWILTFLFFLL